MNIKVIDVTRKVCDGMEAYPGDRAGVAIDRVSRADTDGYNLSRFSLLEAHCGTHIDSPLHFIADGLDVSSLPLVILPAVIVPAGEGEIGIAPFASAGALGGKAVLVLTGWDSRIGCDDYYTSSPFLSSAAAEFLAKNEVALIGFDFPSPDPLESQDFAAHHILLGKGIPIVEGLVDLDKAASEKGQPYFIAFPLKVDGAEASPVRAAIAFFLDD